MTDDGDLRDRLDRLESLVDRQAETIEALREQVAEMDGGGSVADDESRTSVTRRTALKAGGLAGLLALGSGIASADPQGQVGTADDPVATVHAAALDGPVTGQETVTDLLGDALVVDGGSLSVGVGESLVADAGVLDVAIGPELAVRDGLLRVRPRSEWFSAPNAVEPDDLTAVLDGMDGSGTSADPYVITDDHELQAMNADLDAHYRLGKHVDASDTGGWYGGAGFEPIGDTASRFTGSLDGDGRTIEGLTIDRPGTSDVGCFGFIEDGATVENVRLTDVDVTGNENVGGLVGHAITSTVRESSVSGTVSAVNDTVGGLVGDNGGDVSESFATASVDGSQEGGGLVGRNFGTVETSHAAGSVSGSQSGGFVGRNSGDVETSFAAGSVSGSDSGGFVSHMDGTVTNSYWDTATTGQPDAVFFPVGTTTNLIGLTTAEMQGSDAASNMSNLDFGTVWTTRSDDYATLQVFEG